MPQRSAGILLFRDSGPRVEVFLVHPGGPFYARRRDHVWSIPKGLVEPGEDELAAAARELDEETGLPAAGPFLPLGEVRYAGGKTVVAWACRLPGDGPPETRTSTMFQMEWPPGSGRMTDFPEVDEGRLFTIPDARQAILPAQEPFLDRLLEPLERRSS